MPSLEAIRYSRGSLALLDQRLLPATTEYAAIADANAGHDAIKCVRACVRPAHQRCRARSAECMRAPRHESSARRDSLRHHAERLEAATTGKRGCVAGRYVPR